jgi:heme-degrading monooxygenase HmoA
MSLGEMCNVVKNTYGDDKGGFIGGQVYKFSGFISDEGTVSSKDKTDDHIAIVTYWKSFEQHEKSHADGVFKEKFDGLVHFAQETYEIGYEMLWQGDAES